MTDSQSTLVASPCISVCFLDDDDICLGCYRSAREITDWSLLSSEDKLKVLSEASRRNKEKNKHSLL